MNFCILIFDEVEELNFVGPWEMLTMWSKRKVPVTVELGEGR